MEISGLRESTRNTLQQFRENRLGEPAPYLGISKYHSVEEWYKDAESRGISVPKQMRDGLIRLIEKDRLSFQDAYKHLLSKGNFKLDGRVYVYDPSASGFRKPETTTTEAEVKQQFYEYLSHTFGAKFVKLIDPPEDVRIGERVLYKLTSQKEAMRKEVSQKEIDDLRQKLATIAENAGIAPIEVDPPTTSGLPYPRLVDIGDYNDVAMDAPARAYIVSNDLLPKPDFSIEWLFGTVFRPSDKQLVFVDFAHPQVKAAFSFEYDFEYGSPVQPDMYKHFRRFKALRNKVIREAKSKSELLWVKILQLDEQILIQYNYRG